jgi:uncharacterized protein YdbL (DUF1318 family)
VKLFGGLAAAAALVAAAVPVAAQSRPEIAAAKRAGTVGERYDGYLGLASSATEQVRRQVGAVNIKRRSLYTDLAARRGATVQEVGIAAGCQLLAGVNVGESYMLSDGSWHRRPAGAPPPNPDYCGH